jgi:anaerobic magnesium-protoporphyrin IX monomethyl ester cyclase
LAYIAARLEREGHTVQILDCRILGISAEKVVGHFDFEPDLLGLSVNIINHSGAVKTAEILKQRYPHVPIIFGGPYPSSLPEEILAKHREIDAVAVGEGEDTMAELARQVGTSGIFSGIDGLWFRNGHGVECNPPRALAKNIDDIPPPAYHLLPPLRVYKSRSRSFPVGHVLTSRGCPYRCSFCNRNIFGTTWRSHSAERVLAEIEHLVKRYGIRQLDILDDNFTLDHDRAKQILEGIIRRGFKLDINLQNGIRVDRTDDEMLGLMKRAGVFKIAFGIESADPEVQGRAHKVVDLERARKLTGTARSLGIVTHGFFIIGLPGDTPETMERTLQYAIEMNPHYANFSVCIPFPGTEIYQEIKQNGQFVKDVENGVEAGYYSGRVYFQLPGMDPKNSVAYFKKMNRVFYMRPTKLADMFGTVRSWREIKWMTDIWLELIGLK